MILINDAPWVYYKLATIAVQKDRDMIVGT